MLYPSTFLGGSLARPLYETEFHGDRAVHFQSFRGSGRKEGRTPTSIQSHCWQEELQA
jgi:hypothetical protein